MRVIIAGSRSFTDYEKMVKVINQSKFVITEVICGMAPGADLLGKRYGDERGIPVREMPAAWNRRGDQYDRAAGHKRNEEMAKVADAVIAFWDTKSKGTKNMIELAKKYDLQLYVYAFDPETMVDPGPLPVDMPGFAKTDPRTKVAKPTRTLFDD